jgi:4-amino-4-deoxy-L-arabinose transferase-like glycosyltransferase
MAMTMTPPTAVETRPVEVQPARPLRPARPRGGSWHRLGLAAVLVLAGGLNLWGLNRVGYGNAYYAAAVLSMLHSWHNFLFVSFDPGGFVSIDKPPLGFWIQAASAKLLGFSGLSILLPEALAGVGSVAVLYHLVRRAYGRGAGLLAALLLAITPVSVSVSRNNTIDSLLVFTLLLAAWATVKAAETGRLRWLLLSAVVVGLGFEIKMLEAYLVVPALGLVYLLAAPRRRWVRIGHLALAGLVLLGVSFAWPVAVDLTPASQRPWVDSTQDNSAVDLALGYNGIQRLLGRGAVLSLPGATASPTDGSGPTGSGGFGPGGRQENGAPGPLRLVDQQLGGQASWLLGLAAAGLVVSGLAAWRARRRLATSRRGQAALLWGMWLLSAGAFFSVAEYFHSYYLVTLGPPIAALAAIGTVGAWRAFRARGRDAWLLPAALVAGGLVEARVLAPYTSLAGWLVPLVLGVTIVGSIMLVAVLLAGARGRLSRPVSSALGASVAGLAVAALLLAPGAWAAMPALGGQGGGFLPAAGPGLLRGGGAPAGFDGRGTGQAGLAARGQSGPNGAAAAGGGPVGAGAQAGFDGPGGVGAPSDGGAPTYVGAPGASGGPGGFGAPDGLGAPGDIGGGFGGPGGFGQGGATEQALIDYLQANQGAATYLVATSNSNAAAPIILATGQPVMSLGGFLGSDPILSVQQFASLVQAGTVRFVLAGGGPGFGGGSSGIMDWVQQHCAPVSLGTSTASTGRGAGALYDCAAPAGG